MEVRTARHGVHSGMFGGPLVEKQGYTHRLIVPNAVRLEAARAYIEQTARRLDSGEEDLQVEGSISKFFATEAGDAMANDAIQLIGKVPPPLCIERLVDLAPVTRENYYHPDMLGSWSIKAVLPTIAPDMDYAELEGIREGTEASAAYLEAIDPGTSQRRREALRIIAHSSNSI